MLLQESTESEKCLEDEKAAYIRGWLDRRRTSLYPFEECK
jgi:hypothetical protein